MARRESPESQDAPASPARAEAPQVAQWRAAVERARTRRERFESLSGFEHAPLAMPENPDDAYTLAVDGWMPA